MDGVKKLKNDYPWIQTPFIVGAPMRLIALADMATEISKAGGLGFIGAGTDVSDLEAHIQAAIPLLTTTTTTSTITTTSTLQGKKGTLPIGIGFINWGTDLDASIRIIKKYKPTAVWFFAPKDLEHLREWTQKTREASPETKIWVQVGSLAEALLYHPLSPDVLVVQGTDAGGHGLVQGASIISLVPEVIDRISSLSSSSPSSEQRDGPVILAAGGIMDARGTAAALTLGASGAVLGTRLLAAKEANISRGYQNEILRASDGGQSTVRTKVYDNLRGTTGWAETHNARGVINKSFIDAVGGMGLEENQELYKKEMEKGDAGWGVGARMTTYAGSGVGLAQNVKGAGEIIREVREGTRDLLKGIGGKL